MTTPEASNRPAKAPAGLLRIQPIVFTSRMALWRDLLGVLGLTCVSEGGGHFVVFEGAFGSLALHRIGPATVEGGPELIPEGTVKLAWTVTDLAAFREDADAAGFATELVHQDFGAELRVELPDLGWVDVTEDALASPGDPQGVPRVVARVNALDVDATDAALSALGWQRRFAAVDGTYVSLASEGLVSIAHGTRLPTVGEDATAVLALEVDTPRTEADHLGEEGIDAALVEQSWGWSVEVPTPSDWILRLVQPPLDDPAYEYADQQEQASADSVAADDGLA